MERLGDTPEPAGFRYREIFRKGKPQHTETDPFRCRHPCMEVGRRARIFAPFDALRGFREALAGREDRSGETAGEDPPAAHAVEDREEREGSTGEPVISGRSRPDDRTCGKPGQPTARR